MTRKDFFLVLGCLAAVIAGGCFYYFHVSKPPPAPKDLTRVFPKELLEKASAGQLAMLRGETSSAPLVSATPRAAARTAVAVETPGAKPESGGIVPPGLALNLSYDGEGRLKGQAVNATGKDITFTLPGGTLLTNGSAEVVTLWEVPMKVLASATLPLSVPVALTSSAHPKPAGNFQVHAGSVEALKPLLNVFAQERPHSPGAMQTAVLAVTEDVPLDVVAGFPRLRPLALTSTENAFQVSTVEILQALSLLKEAGMDIDHTAMMSEPQLKLMAMVDPESHAAAMNFYGITDQTEWPFWRDQLLQGDPTLRHFALYGIARSYPDVALVMMPTWVRDRTLYHSYRVSAAWALALIDDARAQGELETLREEFKDDVGVRQAIERALHHREPNGAAKAAQTEAVSRADRGTS